MGFYFRRRSVLGPLHLNWSKSGLGLSLGVRGLRAGVSSHGKLYTSANLPGSGLFYRKYYGHHHAAQPRPFAVGFWIGVFLPMLLVLLVILRCFL